MKLSFVERWILSNQFRILEKFDPHEEHFYKNAYKILEEGYELLYEETYSNVYPDGQTFLESECLFVLDVLDMFSAIYSSLDNMHDKEGINEGLLKFSGFDGNNEPKYLGFTKFYCSGYDSSGRYPEITEKLTDFNSHCRKVDVYQRMLEVWKSCSHKNNLSKEDLIAIATSAIHPTNR